MSPPFPSAPSALPPADSGTAADVRRGSVLVIVLVTLLFATTALLLFMDRASTDLVVDAREADAQRLQTVAYSALETTLAVLQEFYQVGNGLHSPHEGWAEPLEWAGYEPPDGMSVEVEFQDESGKLSLPRTDPVALRALFESWELPPAEGDRLVDALLGWMQKDYTPKTAGAPQDRDYENTPLPFHPPARPLRSFSELRAIEFVREQFFNEQGQLTDLGRRFIETVSLYDYSQPNINAAPEGVLSALGGYDPYQQRQLSDFRQGAGAFAAGQRFFRSAGEVATVLGEQGVASGFGANILALRVIVTVRDGRSQYRTEAVIAPPNGAKLVSAPAIPAPVDESERPAAAPPAKAGAADEAAGERKTPAAGAGLQYPFTILEIRENAAIASGPVEVPPHLRSPKL